MRTIMDVIRERRSVRKFLDQPIPANVLNDILESVKWSPSWSNTQCWEVVVVKENAIKESLQATLMSRNPATAAVGKAPVVLALCGKLKSAGFYKETATTKFGDWFMFDLGLAAQNICLAARDAGLGTVIVGAFDHDKANKALKTPDGYEVVVLIPLGYPDQSPSAPQRREIESFTHMDTF
jgi:nitroreductase